ncbi:MAG TPA: hypothetical protein VNF68_11720 [Candidatus Baltobacteraceae bacterium]|nr:hypothetical protein [Candidatus Baltobacteraceae bacterium]
MIAAVGLAYGIFDMARAYGEAHAYPHRIAYSVTIEVTEGTHRKRETYLSALDAASGRIWVDPVSDYERRHPATGRGVAFCVNAGGSAFSPFQPVQKLCAPHIDPAPDQDFIGVPVLAPVYSFGLWNAGPANDSTEADSLKLVNEIRREFNDPARAALPTTPTSAPPQIADVIAISHVYAIALVGMDEIRGSRCYHLSLKPLRNAGRNRLRDLWVRPDGATLRARIALNFIKGPGTAIPWTINFANTDGAQYIRSETAEGPYRYARRTYSQVTIRFDSIEKSARPLPLQLPFSAYLKLKEPT